MLPGSRTEHACSESRLRKAADTLVGSLGVYPPARTGTHAYTSSAGQSTLLPVPVSIHADPHSQTTHPTQRENVWRKHNFIPFMIDVLRVLAEKNELMPLVEKAKGNGTKPSAKA